ncbi:MAG: peptide MFS transporter [Calditrichia bacterium]
MFKDQPRGLPVLFFTEMWERFSYYGMRAILILFLTAEVSTGGFGLTTELSGAIYGMYTALVYLLALPGGWIADKLIGQKMAVYYGGIIIALGHFSMAVPMQATFYLGLMLIVVGTGLLKPNVSAIVGDIYPEGGARRDAGFSIFYMGINLGAFLGPIIVSYLGENPSFGWHWGFGAAGVGMVAGLVQYRRGMKHLEGAGEIEPPTGELRSALMRQLAFGVIALVAIGGIFAVLHQTAGWDLTKIAEYIGYFGLALGILWFLAQWASTQWDAAEKKRLGVVFLLFIGAAVFWSGFEQAGSSLNLFANDMTERMMGSFLVPAGWLQSVNALFIIIFAPIFGSLWVWLSNRSQEPNIATKFGLGLLLLAVGFLVMAWASQYTVDGAKVGMGWLIATYFFHTVGELCLSPVGLSSVTKLSPKPLAGQAMGIWFLGAALGNLFAGLIGGQFDNLPLDQLFTNVALTGIIAGTIFLLFTKAISKMQGGVR